MPVNRTNFKLDMIKLAAYAVCRYRMQLTKHALITRIESASKFSASDCGLQYSGEALRDDG